MPAIKFADRVAESTVYVGTGDITLAGAIDTDHDSFGNQFADGDEMPVAVYGGGKWMTFRGRYNSGANTITRMTFRDSSTGSNLSLSGTMTVICGWGAFEAGATVRTDEAQSFSSGQMAQGQANLGAVGYSSAQALNSGQQVQARANIAVGDLGFTNRVLNPSGQINQTGTGAAANGTYWFDQWVHLNQTNSVNPSQLFNAENGTPYMIRTTQPNVTAQRFGILQPLEVGNVSDLRGSAVTLSARVRMSVSTTLRYAIVEWNGTSNSPTINVVNNWTSATFTTGNFFISTTTTIVATGSVALSANTFASISLTGTVSGSMNNLHVFFWTDSTQAQNVTLDIGKVQLEAGSVATAHALRSIGDEKRLLERYQKSITAYATGVSTSAPSGLFSHRIGFEEMLKVPTPTTTASSGGFVAITFANLTRDSGEIQWALAALNTFTSGSATFLLKAQM